MLTIQQLKLPVSHTENELEKKDYKNIENKKRRASFLVHPETIPGMPEKKPDLFFVYTIDAEVKKESTVLKRVDHKIVMSTKRVPYTYLHTDNRDRLQRPVVVGSGPAGLFCAYYLASCRSFSP